MQSWLGMPFFREELCFSASLVTRDVDWSDPGHWCVGGSTVVPRLGQNWKLLIYPFPSVSSDQGNAETRWRDWGTTLATWSGISQDKHPREKETSFFKLLFRWSVLSPSLSLTISHFIPLYNHFILYLPTILGFVTLDSWCNLSFQICKIEISSYGFVRIQWVNSRTGPGLAPSAIITGCDDDGRNVYHH